MHVRDRERTSAMPEAAGDEGYARSMTEAGGDEGCTRSMTEAPEE